MDEMYTNQGMMEDEDSESQMTVVRDNTIRSDDKEIEENNYKWYIIIEMEFERKDNVSDPKYAGVVLHIVQKLLQAWTIEKVINNAYNEYC